MAKLIKITHELPTYPLNVAGILLNVPLEITYVTIDGNGDVWGYEAHPSGPFNSEELSELYWDASYGDSIKLAEFGEITYDECSTVYQAEV